MKKTNSETVLPDLPPVEDTALEVIPSDGERDIRSLFARQVNGNGAIRNITLKRVLTKPMLAMAHIHELYFTCTSEVYVMILPSKSRGGALSPVRVVDGIEVNTNYECTLMLNEIMCSSFKRGGFKCIDMPKGATAEEECKKVDGASLIGKSFAFVEGIKREGAGYRSIDCAEIELTAK